MPASEIHFKSMNEIEEMEENDFMPKFHSENNVDAIK